MGRRFRLVGGESEDEQGTKDEEKRLNRQDAKNAEKNAKKRRGNGERTHAHCTGRFGVYNGFRKVKRRAVNRSIGCGLEMDDRLESVLVEARAKILWGDSISEVSEWLRGQGLTDEQNRTIIRTCLQERAAEVRKMGHHNIGIGGSLLLLPVGVYVVMSVVGIYYGGVLGLCFLGALYGFSLMLKGIGQLVRGSKTSGSLSDM